jgi:hypothetical protein
MASKKKKGPAKKNPPAQQQDKLARYGGLVVVILIAVAAGFFLRGAFFDGQAPAPAGVARIQPAPQAQAKAGGSGRPLVALVQQVAVNFRCACGGCGELPLATCTCDMPKGAVEEKSFIRAKLQQGLSVAQVIEAVDKKYGHRNL